MALNLQFSFTYWLSNILKEYCNEREEEKKAFGRSKILRYFLFK